MKDHKKMPERRKANRQDNIDGFLSDLPSRMLLVHSGCVVGSSPTGTRMILEDKRHPVH